MKSITLKRLAASVMLVGVVVIAGAAQGQLSRNFCAGFKVNDPNGAILFADFNGDKFSDVLCHQSDGKKEVWYRQAGGNYSVVSSNDGWCGHSGAQVQVGNFDGDKYADVLCADSAGSKWIEYGSKNGFSWNTEDWVNRGRFCSHAGAKLFLGYINADRKTDLLCHDTSGKLWVAYAKSRAAGQFFAGETDSTEDWKDETNGFCSHPGATFSISDMNGDGRSDLVCRDSALKLWVQYADPQGRYFTAGSARFETPAYNFGCIDGCNAEALACIVTAFVTSVTDPAKVVQAFIGNNANALGAKCDADRNRCAAACPAFPPGSGPPPGKRGYGPVQKMR